MKYVPRAEISTIKEVLYPLRKKKDTTWDKRNLKDLQELKEKIVRLREEKQKEIDNKPQPFKLKQFQNIPSKFKDTEDWVVKKQKRYLEGKEKSENIFIQNSGGRHHAINSMIPKILNKSASIKKLPKIKENRKNLSTNKLTNNISSINNQNNESKSYSSINELINNNINNTISNVNNKIINNNNDNNNNNDFNNNNNEFNIEKELEKIPAEKAQGPSIFERPMSNGEEIEKLIQDYKKKYGDTEVLESLIREYEEVKQKKKANLPKENMVNNDIKEENHYNNYNANVVDDLQEYEPIEENIDDKKPPLPTVDDAPLLLPKIYKNNVKENIKLIVDNKKTKKKYIDNSETPEAKHKNYGKVPEYIKRFEMERELQRQEKIRRKEELKYPKGTKLLSEEERKKILQNLIKTQQELSLYLEKMPISNRNLNVQQRRDLIVKKLLELDRAIDMFSKKRVFVKK